MGLSFLQRVDYRAGSVLPLGLRNVGLDRGILSVTFDDFPRSAWQVGGEMLAEVGGQATYYAAGTFHAATIDGAPYFTAEDMASLVAAGHEVGCHSFDHRSVLEVRVASYLDSVRRNADFVASILPGYRLRSHAFPFGHVRVANRLMLRRHFEVLRGIQAPHWLCRFDPTLLRAAGLEERREGMIDWSRLIDQTARSRGWLILFTHGVTTRPTPYDVHPRTLASVLNRARNEGLEILPVGAALDRMQTGSRSGAKHPGLEADTRQRASTPSCCGPHKARK